MKVLVTGGTGFTGSHLVKRLLHKGHEVSVIDNQRGLFYEELRDAGAKIELATITDKSLVDRMVTGQEVIYHLAAAFRQLNVPQRYYWNVNVDGTRLLLDAAHRFQVRRFVYCSTQGVHGHIKNPPGNERSPIAPEDYYQSTKYEGEKVVREYFNKGLDAVTLRPTAIYGPGDPERFLMLFRMVKRQSFLMFGDGETFYHPVYIDNLVDAFEQAAEKEDIQGETYIIGDENYYSLNELVRHVATSIGISVRIRHFPFGHFGLQPGCVRWVANRYVLFRRYSADELTGFARSVLSASIRREESSATVRKWGCSPGSAGRVNGTPSIITFNVGVK